MAPNRNLKTRKKSNLFHLVICGLKTALISVTIIIIGYIGFKKAIWFWNQRNRNTVTQEEKSWLQQTQERLYKLIYNDEKTDQNSVDSSLSWEQIYEDFHIVTSYTSNLLQRAFKHISTSISHIFLLLFMLLIFVLAVYLFRKWHSSKRKVKKKAEKGDAICEEENKKNNGSILHRINIFTVTWMMVFLAFLLSIPWEFCRLYQIEVAKRVSLTQAGSPPECVPDQMTMFQSIKYWIQWQLSWQHDPCEKYYKTILVDPLLEIPPLLVISSAFTRSILHPTELLFEGIGRSLKLFFNEIPAVWQPFMLVTVLVILIIILLISCNYRISLPFILKIEPKTPVFVQTKSRNSNKDICCLASERKQLEFSENG